MVLRELFYHDGSSVTSWRSFLKLGAIHRRRVALGICFLLLLFFFGRDFKSSESTWAEELERLDSPDADIDFDKPRLKVPNMYPYRAGSSKLDDRGCPDYSQFSAVRHPPYSKGPLGLGYQRPAKNCREFQSETVEKVIQDMKSRIENPDLARLFENCFPNTLDTTIKWHNSGRTPQTFVVTGDINAEWLRDSQKQLLPYLSLAMNDKRIRKLLLGAINTQAEYVTNHPYCNAFHPPANSRISFKPTNLRDIVLPQVDYHSVFECKFELDSLASFLALSNGFYAATGDDSFLTPQWLKALTSLLKVLADQSIPSFDEDGELQKSLYMFIRQSYSGTETLNHGGVGNPVNGNTSLIRSAFRPSDDATIYQYFIPANAFMAVELARTGTFLKHKDPTSNLAATILQLAKNIKQDVFEYGVYEHPKFGKVFAYEVDGFGGMSIMDDANTPSLLSLPDMGFVKKNDPIYLNTRAMILSKQGNPYYFKGKEFEGIGGPHVGLQYAWPMSHLISIRTSRSDEEITNSLDLILKSTAGLGLMHESIHVDAPHKYTRSWFAWCNSEFAQTMLYLAENKPHLIFGPGSEPYSIKNIRI